MRPSENKKGRGVSPSLQVLGTLIRKLSCAQVSPARGNEQDITWTDNRYTQIKQPLPRVPSLQ